MEDTIADFKDSYQEIKDYYKGKGETFEEAEFVFFYDTASFLEEYSKAFSLAGLERITGINQTQLGHYLHERSKPSRKTIEKIQKGVQNFAHELTAVKFACHSARMKNTSSIQLPAGEERPHKGGDISDLDDFYAGGFRAQGGE